jgi:hypothetical protein
MFKILHHFACDYGILREIKLLNEESNNTLWQWMPFGYDIIELNPKFSSGNMKRFDSGNLIFDSKNATFTYENTTFNLKRLK